MWLTPVRHRSDTGEVTGLPINVERYFPENPVLDLFTHRLSINYLLPL